MSGTTTETASGTIPTGDQRPSPAARSAVASCCINSAAMLQLADGDGYTDEKRAGFRELNERQAQLLFRAAVIADDMLAAADKGVRAIELLSSVLHELEARGVELSAVHDFRWAAVTGASEEIKAVIAKATEGQP